MITMISVSSFQLTHSLSVYIFLFLSLRIYALLLRREVPISIALYYPFNIFQSFIQSLTHSPPSIRALYLSVFSFASFPFEFPMHGARTWMRVTLSTKQKILKVFCTKRKKNYHNLFGENLFHSKHFNDVFWCAHFRCVYKLIQIICQYFMGDKLCILLKIN